MTPQDSDEKFIQYHNERFEKHGDSPMTFWNSKESQEKRFDALTKLFHPEENHKWFSIVDIGCGTGDFLQYLIDRGFQFFSYIGYDINPEFIRIANDKFNSLLRIGGDMKHPDVGFGFKVGGFDEIKNGCPDIDYAVASGIYCFGSSQISVREKYFYDFKKIMPLIRKGYACNFLSDYSQKQNPENIYHDPEKVFNTSMLQSRKVSLHHDYLPNDFTIIVRK